MDQKFSPEELLKQIERRDTIVSWVLRLMYILLSVPVFVFVFSENASSHNFDVGTILRIQSLAALLLFASLGVLGGLLVSIEQRVQKMNTLNAALNVRELIWVFPFLVLIVYAALLYAVIQWVAVSWIVAVLFIIGNEWYARYRERELTALKIRIQKTHS
jgi:uncharacterized metal-binding protein